MEKMRFCLERLIKWNGVNKSERKWRIWGTDGRGTENQRQKEWSNARVKVGILPFPDFTRKGELD